MYQVLKHKCGCLMVARVNQKTKLCPRCNKRFKIKRESKISQIFNSAEEARKYLVYLSRKK